VARDVFSGTLTSSGSEAQPDFPETSSMTVDEPVIERAAARSTHRLVSRIPVASALCMHHQANMGRVRDQRQFSHNPAVAGARGRGPIGATVLHRDGDD